MSATPASSKSAPRKHSWLFIVEVALAAIILAVLALPLFINADARRPEIAAALSRATGRQISMEKIRFRVLPTPSVIIENFQIGNPSDFPAGNLFAAETIHAHVSWAALLRDRFVLTSIEFDQPILAIQRSAAGNNYSSAAAAKVPITSGGNAANQSDQLFEISPDAILVFVNASASLANVSPSAPPVQILAAHSLNFQISSFVGNYSNPAAWVADATLDGSRIDLASLAAPITLATGHATLSHATLEATFHAQAATIADVKGALRVANITRGNTTFEISTPTLDAHALLAALRKLPGSPPVTSATSPRDASASAPSSELLADGRITADRVDWAPYAGGNASAQIRFYSDRTELWPASVTLYGGQLQLTARTDARQQPERFSANIQLRTLDLGRLLAQAPPTLRGKISGLTDIDLELLGSVGGAWRQALAGNGRFMIRNGKFPGPHIGGTLGHLANAAGLNEIPFKQISADITIAAGRAAITQGAVEASLVTATYSGVFTLMDQSLDVTGVAKFSPAKLNDPSIRALLGSALQNKAAAATLPFAIRGPASNPIFTSGRSAAADTRPVPR